MRYDDNGRGSVNYEPNSFDGYVEVLKFKEPPLPISGDADRYNHRAANDDFTQAGNLYRLMTKEQKDRLYTSIACLMKEVPNEIISRQLDHFRKAYPPYLEGVRKALKKIKL